MDSNIGKKLDGRYELLELIGVGGMAEIYRAKIIDYNTDTMCVEVTGEPSKIKAFIDVMKPLGIIEICRTGVVALERGCNILDK